MIYKYTCHCQRTYVGKTSQIFHEESSVMYLKSSSTLRLEQKQRLPHRTRSAIIKHLMTNKDCIPTDPVERFELLTRARNKSHLNILEVLFIRNLTPELRAQKEFVKVLSSVVRYEYTFQNYLFDFLRQSGLPTSAV